MKTIKKILMILNLLLLSNLILAQSNYKRFIQNFGSNTIVFESADLLNYTIVNEYILKKEVYIDQILDNKLSSVESTELLHYQFILSKVLNERNSIAKNFNITRFSKEALQKQTPRNSVLFEEQYSYQECKNSFTTNSWSNNLVFDMQSEHPIEILEARIEFYEFFIVGVKNHNTLVEKKDIISFKAKMSEPSLFESTQEYCEGSDNKIIINQSVKEALSFIVQKKDSNSSDVNQHGRALRSEIEQISRLNYVDVLQSGSLNASYVFQNGCGNNVFVNQMD